MGTAIQGQDTVVSGNSSCLACFRTPSLSSALSLSLLILSTPLKGPWPHQKSFLGLKTEALPKMSQLELSHRQPNGPLEHGHTAFVSETWGCHWAGADAQCGVWAPTLASPLLCCILGAGGLGGWEIRPG